MPTRSETAARATAYRTKLSDVEDLVTMPIYSTTEPNLCGLLGIGDDLGYAWAREKKVPVVRVGRRIFVRVQPLLTTLTAPAEQ